MLGWGEASAWHRRLADLHYIPTATQVTGKPSKKHWIRLLWKSGLFQHGGMVHWLSHQKKPKEKRETSRQQQGIKGWSGAASDHQGSSFAIQLQCPSTACRAQFCLLCCQPEPVPRSLTARMPRLTSCQPCRLHAWMG